jgi:DNA repair/transcription protein MET18/MMS19
MSFAADGLLLLLTQYEEILPPDSASKFVATLASDVSVPSLDHATRHKLLSILRAITRSQKWLEDVGKEAKSFGSCVVLSVEGEKDPRCLVVALEVVQRTLRRISSDLVSADGGDSVLEELFDVAACYFPIAFTPPPNNPHGITREMLVDGLAAVFTSTFRIARFVMPLLFEKLSSAIVSAKLDALSALKLCIRAYGATALLPYVREICDALRGEVIHGSDEAVTKAALETITALVSALTGHADDLPVTYVKTCSPRVCSGL